MTDFTSFGSESAFRALRHDADEVLRLRTRAAAVFARRRPTSFDGFGDLLDQVLPADAGAGSRIARAVKLREVQLAGLRASELDPASVPVDALTALARAMGLERDTFAVLLARDHARFAGERGLVEARALEEERALLGGVDAAWRRAEMDDASDY